MAGYRPHLVDMLKQQSRSDIERHLRSIYKLEAELVRLYHCKQEAPPQLRAFSVKKRREYFYGREEQEKAILDWILEKKTGGKVVVVNITGEAGSGKSALAGLIYTNAEVVKAFQVRVWVSVPERATVFRLVKKILEIVTDDLDFSGSQSDDLQWLLAKLESWFAGRRFLLVLDNCWIIKGDSGDWDKLITSLGITAGTGSAMILTGAPLLVQDQVFMPPADGSVHLEPMQEKDCGSIFWDHINSPVVAGHGFDDDPQPELKEDGWAILKKLDGLPLAAKMVGSFLQEKNLDAWTQMDRSLNTRLHKRYHGHLPFFLKLCYLDLPKVLRLCLAVLSIYPKGYAFNHKQVVHLWMALGFLHGYKSHIKSMEEVGDEYLSYLTYRSFLQRSGDGVSFIIHDLVRDLASNEFNKSYERSHVLHFGSEEIFRNLVNVSNVLSILLPWGSPDVGAGELCEKSVLCLSGTGITELPPSIGELTSSLSFLDLSHSALRKLPNSIGKLHKLKTLLLTNCSSLISLPDTVTHLKSLLYLDIRRTKVQEMPPKMSSLTSLQTLTHFIVSKSVWSFQDLGGLSNIETLAIANLQNVAEAAQVSHAKLKEKTNLNDLTLQWGRGCKNLEIHSQVLENLIPPESLKILTIEHYSGAEFPSWLGNELFQVLQSVTLRHCNCISLPPLGQLPSLKHLIIEGLNKVTHVGSEFFGRTSQLGPFPSLESLQFRHMLEWKEWKILENIEFEHLLELSIVCCPKLVGGLPQRLSSLEKLEISRCYDLAVTLSMIPLACELCVHDNNEVLMTSVDKAPCRRVIVPFEGKSCSSVPTTEVSHNERKEVIEEPDATPLDAPVVVDTIVTDNAGADSSQMENSSSEDEQSASFEMLVVSNVSQFENQLPTRLDGLRIEECTNLMFLPETLHPLLPTLLELHLINCYSLKSFPPGAFPISLRTLYVNNCPKLEIFSSLNLAQKLEKLCIESSCDSLEGFPLDIFLKLKTLSLWNCSNLSSFTISEEFKGDISLESLEISDCPNLKSFPKRGLSAPYLASILLSNCKILNNMPNFENSQWSLQSLVLRECPSLESLSLAALPSTLTSLSIASCAKLTPHRSWGLHNLEFLGSFEIEGGYKDMKLFPEKGLLPRNLNTLRISGFQSLEKLDDIGNQKSLQALDINGCNKLESLPEYGLPPSLIYLCIYQCELLKEKLLSKSPEDWCKVAHIPHIEIDGDVMS